MPRQYWLFPKIFLYYYYFFFEIKSCTFRLLTFIKLEKKTFAKMKTFISSVFQWTQIGKIRSESHMAANHPVGRGLRFPPQKVAHGGKNGSVGLHRTKIKILSHLIADLKPQTTFWSYWLLELLDHLFTWFAKNDR